MNILIAGSGAIGRFIGSVLHSGNEHRVFFYDIPEIRERIRKNGINLMGFGENRRLEKPDVIENTGDMPPMDLAVLSVKSFDTESVLLAFPRNFARRIITFQNGIGNEEILRKYFDEDCIISGTVTYPVSVEDDGAVRIENLKGGLGIAPVKTGNCVSDMADLLGKVGFTVSVFNDYRAMKWSKLLLNMICNATCAITGLKPGDIFADRRGVWIEKACIMEFLELMKMLKLNLVDLPGYPVRITAFLFSVLPPSLLKALIGSRIAKSRGSKKPSLMLDMEKNTGKTEIDYYNGAVVSTGRERGIDFPANRRICEIFRETVDNLRSRKEYEDIGRFMREIRVAKGYS